ncbi:toxin [Corynebacterium sp. p3-SID1056]|uniref:toxin n=1 Tax=Corynebacterium sp. p3-SID1056 TaxID=2916092 RepID=UPI0028830A96|nr:toxin [Corynebacterium sp. p3-SID1056]
MVKVTGNSRSVEERNLEMEVRGNATKHGITPKDSITAATSGCVFSAALDEEHPQRELRLGFDGSSRLLEIVVLVWDDHSETIIHSMKARKKYRALLD